MLKVLAVSALIATTNAVFIEYSEDNANMLIFRENEITSPSSAEAINSDRVYLNAKGLSGSADGSGHNICGNDLGFNVANVGTFCKPSFIHVMIEGSTEHTNDSQDEEVMHLTIYFSYGNDKEGTLNVPIFKIPSKIHSTNPEELQTWAEQNKVGLLSSDYVQTLSAVRPNQELTTDFKWLNDLLKFGVFIPEDQDSDTPSIVFISPPIVLSEEHMQGLKAWMYVLSS